jgi:iron(III) transport system permease protein
MGIGVRKPGWETITIQMFVEITAGRLPVAAAYAVFLFLVSALLATAAMRLAARGR